MPWDKTIGYFVAQLVLAEAIKGKALIVKIKQRMIIDFFMQILLVKLGEN
jgi:hypothetical protein